MKERIIMSREELKKLREESPSRIYDKIEKRNQRRLNLIFSGIGPPQPLVCNCNCNCNCNCTNVMGGLSFCFGTCLFVCVWVCMCVCMCHYFSETTYPIVMKLYHIVGAHVQIVQFSGIVDPNFGGKIMGTGSFRI